MKHFFQKHQNTIKLIGVFDFLFFLAFLILLKSPINLWSNGDTYTDSSVFKTVALMMSKGYMPYKDIFDHKGPIIYLINLLGLHLSYYRGIWVLEFINMFLTFTFMYKTARLCCNRFFSCLAVLVCATLLFPYFEGGNFVEEYALPFLASSLYIFLDYFLNQKINKIRLLWCGFSCGAIFLLRPNMISLWVVFCFAVLFYRLFYAKGKDIGKFLLYFLIGFGLLVIPIIVWLVLHHSFGAFIEDYFLFNMLYSSLDSSASLSNRLNTFIFFFHETIFLFSFLISVYFMFGKKNRFLNITYVIYLLFTMLCICVSGRNYGHYGMILIPAIVYPIASFFSQCQKSIETDEHHITAFFLAYLFVSIILPNWLELTGQVGYIYSNRNQNLHSPLAKSVSEYVLEHSSEEDKISVYGNWNIIYVLTKRFSASTYSYQDPIGKVDPSIMDKYYDDLRREKPKIIILSMTPDEKMMQFLEEYHYQSSFREKQVSIYELES